MDDRRPRPPLPGARAEFALDERVELLRHDLTETLPAWGAFDDGDCHRT